jgi:hypothetical protein
MPRYLCPVFLLLFLVLAGCHAKKRSEPVATLEGQVTVNGKPLPEDAVGSVVFMPRVKGQARAAEAKIQGGHYRVEEAPLGAVTALFHISRSTGKMIKDSPRDEHPHPELIDLVPAKQRFGVPVTIAGDNPHQDFDLRD